MRTRMLRIINAEPYRSFGEMRHIMDQLKRRGIRIIDSRDNVIQYEQFVPEEKSLLNPY